MKGRLGTWAQVLMASSLAHGEIPRQDQGRSSTGGDSNQHLRVLLQPTTIPRTQLYYFLSSAGLPEPPTHDSHWQQMGKLRGKYGKPQLLFLLLMIPSLGPGINVICGMSISPGVRNVDPDSTVTHKHDYWFFTFMCDMCLPQTLLPCLHITCLT